MRILLTGAGGRLGRALLRLYSGAVQAAVAGSCRDRQQSGHYSHLHRGLELLCPDRAALDLRRTTDVRAWLAHYQPHCIIHTAARTQVDAAEEDAQQVMTVNAGASAELARWAGAHGACMLYVSTDYVFDGGQRVPYRPDDVPRPLNVYGVSKWHGEQAVRAHCPQHWILRSSWLHHDVATVQGAAAGVPPCFAQTILQRLLDGLPVQVVSDQAGTPTSYTALARTIWRLLLGAAGEAAGSENRASVSAGAGTAAGNSAASRSGNAALPAAPEPFVAEPFAPEFALPFCQPSFPLFCTPFGIHHAAGAQVMSWHALAQRVADSAWQRGLIAQPVRVLPISTASWNARLRAAGKPAAQRPAYSALASCAHVSGGS